MVCHLSVAYCRSKALVRQALTCHSTKRTASSPPKARRFIGVDVCQFEYSLGDHVIDVSILDLEPRRNET